MDHGNHQKLANQQSCHTDSYTPSWLRTSHAARFCPILAQSKSCRINIYKSVSKQATLTVIMHLTQKDDKISRPHLLQIIEALIFSGEFAGLRL